jgi:hypothetical protein
LPSCNLQARLRARYKQLDHHAERTIRETRDYGDAEQLPRTETSAVDFFNAKIENDPMTRLR